MAERLLRSRIPVYDASIAVSSAGLGALVGAPIDPPSARALARHGVDSDGHRARQYVSSMGQDADLVLTAEVSQRDEILRDAPRLMRRTFTIREFVRLGVAAQLVGDSPRLRIAEVAERRGLVDAVAPQSDDIRDPFGLGDTAAAECVDALLPLTATIGAICGW